MAPPSYADLGKASKDLFNKHYHFGLVKLDLKLKTPTNVEYSVNGSSNTDTGRSVASLETKYNIKNRGITLKQKWITGNVFTFDVSAEDCCVRGLKTGVVTSLAPQNGKTTSKLVCGYKSQFVNANGDVDLDYTRPVFNGASVFGYQGWLAGMKVKFDPAKNKLSNSNFALGYQTPQFHVVGNLDDGQDFNCYIYQRHNEDLETGINVAWSSNTNDTRFGLGCHYRIDSISAIRAKINSSNQVGIGYIHKLRPGLNLTMNAQVDAMNFSQGGHKVGLGFDLEI